MKKSILISVGFIFLLAIGFVMSCDKQEMNQEPTEQTVIDPVLMKILNFKDKIENPDRVKSGEMICVDSAVWYIEAALNYTYCVIQDSTEIYLQTKLDSAITNIDVDNEQILVSDVVNSYFMIESVVLKKLDKIKNDNKRINIVDVTFCEGQFITYFEFNFGDKIFDSKFKYSIRGDWEWGFNLGMCDGSNFGIDLTDKIATWLRYNRATAYGVTWTNVSMRTENFSSIRNLPNPVPLIYENLYGYGVEMFFEPFYGENHEYCVSQPICNACASETNQALDVIKKHYLDSGYDVKDYYIHYIELTVAGYGTYIGHYLNVKQGKPVVVFYN